MELFIAFATDNGKILTMITLAWQNTIKFTDFVMMLKNL